MARKNYGLYVFDWDGTVMDTTGLIARGIQEAARSLGLRVPSLELARSVIGLGAADSMRIVNPDCPRERWGEYAAAYKRWYISREAQVEVMAGLEDLLKTMRGRGSTACLRSPALSPSLRRRSRPTSPSPSPIRRCFWSCPTERAWRSRTW